MALEIYMVGVIVSDMRRAVDFYRRLGVTVPRGSEAGPCPPALPEADTMTLART